MQVPLYVPGGEEAEAPPAPEPAPPGDGRCTASPADGPRTAARAPTGRLTPGGRHGGALMTPGDGETGLLIAFSPPRDALALLAADGRLRTFDTGAAPPPPPPFQPRAVLTQLATATNQAAMPRPVLSDVLSSYCDASGLCLQQ